MVILKIFPIIAGMLLISAIVVNCKPDNSQQPPASTSPLSKFANPIMTGSDPWVTMFDSTYYYMQTQGNRISIWKTQAMESLAINLPVTIHSPDGSAPYRANIWAPELHRINGVWYVYYSAGSGADSTQRLWVLENTATDPTSGHWEHRGRIFNSDADFWAIDGTVLQYNGNVYLLWSGRPRTNEQTQNLYICRMAGPLSLMGRTIMISTPEYSWEKNGGAVNEAPQVLARGDGKIFVVYSGSGCWTDDYCLGLLELSAGGDPLNADDWRKYPEPVFQKNPSGNVYGPGHNAFFLSRDSSQSWIIYHANSNSGGNCDEKRNIHMQPFTWKSNGTPDFGIPVAEGRAIEVP